MQWYDLSAEALDGPRDGAPRRLEATMTKLTPPRPRSRTRPPRPVAKTARHGEVPATSEGSDGPCGTVRMRRKDVARRLEAWVVHPGDLVAGRYRVEAIVDRSMGLLVTARHELFGRPVSLRLLAPHQVDGKLAERVQRQARAVAELDSEHVARILDAGMLPGGAMYVAREHVDGDMLIQRARAAGGLELDEVITVFIQLCEAVQEAHARGIVLRDLRPEHLLVTTKKSGEPVAKIIDLGLCMVTQGLHVENSCTRADLSPWAAPELVRQDRAIDPSADIWSLGCLLYELLCGERPFRGVGPQLMLSIIHDQPAPPSSKRKGLPRIFDTIVRWALDKERARRPRSVHALVHALWPFARLPGQLLIDRIARLASAARTSRPRGELLTYSEDDPTNVLSKSADEPPAGATTPSNAWLEAEPPSLVTPVIPPPCPIPSMDILDEDDPLVRSARRRGVLVGHSQSESALTPL